MSKGRYAVRAALVACGCASREQTGEVLVTAGTTVAAVGASVQGKKSATVAGAGVAMVPGE